MDGSGRVAEFFESKVGDYEEAHYGAGVRSFMTVRQRCILEAFDRLALPAGARVLDAGCGPGHLGMALAERGFEVVELDRSRSMLGKTRSRRGGAAPLLRADITRPALADGSFDAVVSAGVLEYLPDDGAFLAALAPLLRPGAALVLPVTNLWSPAGLLDRGVEALKRRRRLREAFNRLWARGGRPAIRAREFPVRRHRPARLRRALEEAGLELREERYFYVLPWPHPFDRLAPGATRRLGERLEPLAARRGTGWLGEGYLTVSARRSR